MKTAWRCGTLDWIARSPSEIPKIPAATAPHPGRLTSRETAQIPQATARIPRRSGQVTLRVCTGGSAR